MSVTAFGKPVLDQIVAALQADPNLRDAVVRKLAAKHPEEFRAACAQSLSPTSLTPVTPAPIKPR